MSIKVVLVDDHSVVRDGIKAVIERKAPDIKIAGEASDGAGALEIAAKNRVDVYVVDISLPVMNGIDLTARLRRSSPKSRILILSMHDKNTLVEKAIRSGANGYVVKENASSEIIKAIRAVFSGGVFLSPQISDSIPAGCAIGDIDAGRAKLRRKGLLTRRERQILQLISEGFTNREIADKLGRSFNTVHVHRNKIMKKLNIHRNAELVRYALKEDISFL